VKWDEQFEHLLRRAVADEQAMKVLAQAGADPQIIGFHAQQASEKFLKAFLSHHRITYGRSHDLRVLLDLVEKHVQVVPKEVEEVCQLGPYAVEFRYQDIPSGAETQPSAQWMIERVESVRDWVYQQIKGVGSSGNVGD
jgi:HEPN domain-containing protein